MVATGRDVGAPTAVRVVERTLRPSDCRCASVTCGLDCMMLASERISLCARMRNQEMNVILDRASLQKRAGEIANSAAHIRVEVRLKIFV